jgi:hypothetical protein
MPIVMARFTVGGSDPRAYDGREPDQLLFADKKLVLGRGESMILQIIGRVVDCYCEWVVDIEFAIGTETRTITVPDVGRPLRLTPPTVRYQSVYQSPSDYRDEVMTALNPSQACEGDCVANPPVRQR